MKEPTKAVVKLIDTYILRLDVLTEVLRDIKPLIIEWDFDLEGVDDIEQFIDNLISRSFNKVTDEIVAEINLGE